MLDPGVLLQVVPGEPVLEVKAFEVISDLEGRAVRDARHGAVYRLAEEPAAGVDVRRPAIVLEPAFDVGDAAFLGCLDEGEIDAGKFDAVFA